MSEEGKPVEEEPGPDLELVKEAEEWEFTVTRENPHRHGGKMFYTPQE